MTTPWSTTKTDQQRLQQIDDNWKTLKQLHGELHKLYPQVRPTELRSARARDDEWRPPEVQDESKQRTWICTEQYNHNGQYVRIENSSCELACIWVDTIRLSNVAVETVPGTEGRKRIVTEEAWKGRVAVPYEVIAAVLLHEFAHHLDVVLSEHDLETTRNNDDAQHSETWRCAYRDLIKRAKEKGIVAESLAQRAYADCERDRKNDDGVQEWPVE